MALVQVDVLKRIAYPDNPSGYYYWTSVYYVDTDDFENLPQLQADVSILDGQITTQDVYRWGVRGHQPPGSGNVVWQVNYLVGSQGGITSEGSYSLINIARWRLYSASGRYSYRLNRMPLRPSDIDGQQLSDSGYFRQQASLGTFLSRGWCRNSYGELITSGEVVRQLRMWQLRHGTKRRQRNPLA